MNEKRLPKKKVLQKKKRQITNSLNVAWINNQPMIKQVLVKSTQRVLTCELTLF